MSLTIQEVINRVRDQLQDAPEFEFLSVFRYEDDTLLSYITLAYNTLLRLKPTILVERVLHVCAAAPRQRLDPAVHYRLMRVDCNSTAGAPLHGAFIQTVERDVMDTFYSSWTVATALVGEEPTRFKVACTDAKDPLAFWLFPTPRLNDEVWVLASYIPTPPTAVTDLFAFPDEYVAPIVDLVCCIACISVGKDEPAQHSARYLTYFLGALGISTKTLEEIGINQPAAPEATE